MKPRILSITQIGLGVAAIVFQIVNLCLQDRVGIAGTGLWCGVGFIIAGALGINSADICSRIAWLSFSVMAVVLGVTLTVIAGIGVMLEFMPLNCDYNATCPVKSAPIAIDITLAIIGVAAVVVSIIGVFVGARSIQRGRQDPEETSMPYGTLE